MHFKNTLFILTFISLTAVIVCSFQTIDSKRLILTAKIDGRQKVNDVNYLLIKATLTNTSLDTFSYTTMSCFYPFASITDSKFLSPEKIDCIKNIPELVKIPPHSSVEKKFRLVLTEQVDQSKDTTFRIGVNLTTSENVSKLVANSIAPINKKRKLTQIDTSTSQELIWSNKISLN